MNLSDAKITFVGAGSMAEAIIRGLVTNKIATPHNVRVINRQDRAKLEAVRSQYGVMTAGDQAAKDEFVTSADIVVLAFKPKDAVEGLRSLKHLFRPGQLLISVIAGLATATMISVLEAELAIARTMPNTSSTIGLGATGICFSSAVQEGQKQLALSMFESIGIVAVVDEDQLDIVTGVSGSGPAYIYYMMEAMVEGGIRGGLSAEAARLLVQQTVLGAASMVKATGEDPAELRRKVTSPNGTTFAALESLDRSGFAEGVIAAVLRAAERAREIGDSLSESAKAPATVQTNQK
jgi:pyrroline-5-carboxylate reductase